MRCSRRACRSLRSLSGARSQTPVRYPHVAADFVEFREERDLREAVLTVFEEVCSEVGRLLSDAIVEHVGATAIQGAVTKGDLDVCVLVDASAFKHADHLLGGRYARTWALIIAVHTHPLSMSGRRSPSASSSWC